MAAPALARAVRLTLALALAAIATAAMAQGWGRRGSDSPGRFDFYVLSLSWSPTFCDSDAGQRNRQQCGLNSRSEFVLHGFWPQYDRGFPEHCDLGNRPIPRAAMDKAAAIFPDERLARYQWNKHGTCSGLSPSEYFEEAASARARIVIPAAFTRANRDIDTSPMEVERAFVAANRGLRTDMMSVQCKRRMLSEVRICFSRDGRDFVSCPQVDRSACRTRDITIPAAR